MLSCPVVAVEDLASLEGSLNFILNSIKCHKDSARILAYACLGLCNALTSGPWLPSFVVDAMLDWWTCADLESNSCYVMEAEGVEHLLAAMRCNMNNEPAIWRACQALSKLVVFGSFPFPLS